MSYDSWKVRNPADSELGDKEQPPTDIRTEYVPAPSFPAGCPGLWFAWYGYEEGTSRVGCGGTEAVAVQDLRKSYAFDPSA